MNTKRLSRLGVAGFAISLFTFAIFQNCSKVNFDESSNDFASVSIKTIQPSLAARGISCVTCHSAISSNIVTDYGYGSLWYFDTVSPDSFYADRLGTPMTDPEGLATIKLMNNSKIVVPKATIPNAIQTQFGATSLADFIKVRFTQVSPAANTGTQVVEVNSLKINLPTTARIQQVFGNPSANQVYRPDSSNSPALSGLVFDSTNGVFVIQNLTCDGDLYLGAPVLFNNAQVTSIKGCRIYSTGNIFMDVPVVSVGYNGSAYYNTQVLSSQGIWLGTGRIFNGSFCEKSGATPAGWYSVPAATSGLDCANAANQANAACDTQAFRQAAMLARNTFARAYPNATALNSYFGLTGAVSQDRAKVEAHLGHALLDAACSTSGRAAAISRLMLVAPYVNNRFNGSFSGSVVSEAPLMSLGSFVYQFDPIFASVSIFSMLDEGELLSD